MLDIIVCIKQVPDTFDVKFNKDTNTLNRENIKASINPFDTYAIEESLIIKDNIGAKVISLSMGIPSVAELLKETVAMGADEAILLSDRAFAGADTLATAYTLSMGIKKIGKFDLIICGKQAIDGDTAQVGPSLAEKLGIPHATCIKEIQQIEDGVIRCKRITESGYEIFEMVLPALITVVKNVNEPRFPSVRGVRHAEKTPVTIWSLADINADENFCGLKGSPTKVVETFLRTYEKKNEIINGTPVEQAKVIIDKLSDVLIL